MNGPLKFSTARLLVLPKFLRCSQARKANFFISARARKKIAVLGMLANARKDHSSPLDGSVKNSMHASIWGLGNIYLPFFTIRPR